MYAFYFLILLIVLLIASLFSCLETAVVAVSEHRLISLSRDHLWASYALKLKRNLDKVLIFSLFGNSLFNAALTTLSTMLFLEEFANSGHMMLTLITLFVTLIIIIFSEAAPKIIASKVSLQVLRWISIPLYYIFWLSSPVIWLIDRIVYAFTRLIGVGDSDGTSLDDLKAIIADKRVPFIDHHRMIMKNSMEFERLLIKDIVIPLRQVEMINLNDDLADNLQQIRAAHHSKLIVYRDTIDNIIGYISVRDLLNYDANEISAETLNSLVRPMIFIQDFLPIMAQLTYLQQRRQTIFGIVNEYGDVLGIGSVADMLELVFGDFTTDAPDKEFLIIKHSPTEFIVDGAVLIREFNELYHTNLPATFDALSFNGLILKHLRMIPKSGVCFRMNNIILEIMQANDFGVERVKVKILTR